MLRRHYAIVGEAFWPSWWPGDKRTMPAAALELAAVLELRERGEERLSLPDLRAIAASLGVAPTIADDLVAHGEWETDGVAAWPTQLARYAPVPGVPTERALRVPHDLYATTTRVSPVVVTWAVHQTVLAGGAPLWTERVVRPAPGLGASPARAASQLVRAGLWRWSPDEPDTLDGSGHWTAATRRPAAPPSPELVAAFDSHIRRVAERVARRRTRDGTRPANGSRGANGRPEADPDANGQCRLNSQGGL